MIDTLKYLRIRYYALVAQIAEVLRISSIALHLSDPYIQILRTVYYVLGITYGDSLVSYN